MLNSGLPAGHKALKAEMPVEEITAYSDRHAHRERRKDSANTEPFNVPQSEESQRGGHGQAGHVERYLDFRIAHLCNIGRLPREKVCRNYRKAAAVRQSNAHAQYNVAQQKPHHAPRQAVRQNADPKFVNVEKFAEHEPHYKAEQVGRDEFLPHYHQRQDKQSLKDVRPGSERELREHLRKRIWDT